MRYEIEGDTLTNIADAIRFRTGSSNKYYPNEMAPAIRNISGNSILINKNIFRNGTYNSVDDAADGYDKVTVNVVPNLQAKNISRNGIISPDTGYDGFSSVTVNVLSEENNWVPLMTYGQVSSTSSYKTAYFDSDINLNEYNVFTIVLYRDNKQEGTAVVMPNNSSSYEFYIQGKNYKYTMKLYTNSIACTYYSGSYVNLYVNVYGFKLPNIPLAAPYFIQITQLPNTTPKIYANGETIQLTNMKVTAYTAAMDIWGTIPLSEITIETPKAIYDSSKDIGNYTNNNGVNATHYVSSSIAPGGTADYSAAEGLSVAAPNVHFFLTMYNGKLYCAPANENYLRTSAKMKYYNTEGNVISESVNLNISSTFTSIYSTERNWVFPVAKSTKNPSGISNTNMTLIPTGSMQTITISWKRPEDGLKLSTTFEVQVSPSA